MGRVGILLVRMAAIAVAALLVVAIASWYEERQAPPPAATVSPGLSATPSTTVPLTATPTPTSPAPGTPPTANSDPRVAPTGYTDSCASASPWGQQVRHPFVCIEAPRAGGEVAPLFMVRGYAGGSFENNVVIEWQVEGAGGVLSAPTRVPITYAAPDIGMPGGWHLTVNLGGGVQPNGSRIRLLTYFESPEDGRRMAEAVREFRVR